MQIGVNAKEYGPNPYTKICHICGRQFGSQSIAIHQKQCAEKFRQNQAHLPKSQRLPLPKAPTIDPKSAKTDNDAAFETYLEHSRKECPNCSRKFAIDRLDIHLKSCVPGGFFARKNQERLDKSAQKDSSIETLTDRPRSDKKKTSIKSESKPENQSAKTSYCTDCGTAFSQPADNFCGNCGKKRN